MTVRARLPKGDLNGLAAFEQRLADSILDETGEVDGRLIVVGVVQADTVELRAHDDDDGRVVKTVLVHVEVLDAKTDRERADKLMRKLYAERTGKAELPFEDEGGEL